MGKMNNRLIASRSLLLPREKRKKRYFSTIVIFWIIFLIGISNGQDFRIDNQLRITTNDCYTRIAIGSRLPDSSVTSMIPASSLSDCERICSGNRTVCNAFSFGIDMRGNGTCAIGRMDLNMRGRDLIMDPDYDVYERRAKMPRGCQHDRLLKIGYGSRLTGSNSTNANNTNANQQGNQMNVNQNMNNGMRRRPQNPFGNRFLTAFSTNNDDPPREPSFFRGGWYSPLADDSDSRLYDILNNKKNLKSNTWQQGAKHSSQLEYPEQIFGAVDGLIIGSNDFHPHRTTPIVHKWNTDVSEYNKQWNVESIQPEYKWNSAFPVTDLPLKDTFTTPRDSPEHETRNHFDHGISFGYPSGIGIDSVLEKTKRMYFLDY